MRCKMFVWTIFTWLILLENTHVSLCSTCSDDYFEDRELDFDRISKAGGNIKELGTLNVSSLEECAKSCCTETSEQCNIISYNKNRTNSCSRYLCKPLDHCFLTGSKESGVIGKLKESSANTTQSSNLKSTEISLPTTSTAFYTDLNSTYVKKNTENGNSNETLTTVVKNVTQVEYSSTSKTDINPETTTYGSADTFQANLSTTPTADDQKKDAASTPQVYVGTFSTSDGSVNFTTSATTELGERENKIINGTEPNTVKDEYATTTTVSVADETKFINDTDLEIIDVTVKTKLIIANETEPEILNSTIKVKEEALNISVTTSLVETNETEEQIPVGELKSGSDQLRKDIHLIVALVIGLVLLITVLGLVVRRFYDGWQRRHYQRMDFLIDGMYNSPSS